MLDRLALEIGDDGEVCDLGCGPGHVSRYLKQAGSKVFGIDLSPRMIEQACRLNPDIPFRVGNMLALELEDCVLTGIVAYYSIVNIPKELLRLVFREMHRVLRPGGHLLLAFHTGVGVTGETELWGHSITMDFFLLDPAEVQNLLEASGFIVHNSIRREPYAEVEYPSHRDYIIARKPLPVGSPNMQNPRGGDCQRCGRHRQDASATSYPSKCNPRPACEVCSEVATAMGPICFVPHERRIAYELKLTLREYCAVTGRHGGAPNDTIEEYASRFTARMGSHPGSVGCVCHRHCSLFTEF